jgi:hypothetical protein
MFLGTDVVLSSVSGMFIPVPGSEFFPSRIRIKESKYFNPIKLLLSSRKYDPGCSSRIRILIFYPSRVPDPGVKKAPDPGSGSARLILTCGEHVEEYVEWDGDPQVAEDLHPAQHRLLLLHVRVLHPPVKESETLQ